MGGLLAYVSVQATTALKRHAIVYGLWSLGCLFVVFAAGYGLDAVRIWLMFRYGAVLANVIVAGGLIAIAGCLFGLGLVIKWRLPSQSTAPPRGLQYSRSYSPASMVAASAAAAGALMAAVMIAKSRSVRAILARYPRS
jgi:Kef-type K+ transport system membrane component KefB